MKELPEQPTKIKRKRMSRKKKIVLAVLIAVIIIAGFWFWMSYNRRRAMEAIRESASQVETVQVTRQNLIDSISVTGTIASADARDVSASASNVEVLEVNYDVGDYVKRRRCDRCAGFFQSGRQPGTGAEQPGAERVYREQIHRDGHGKL